MQGYYKKRKVNDKEKPEGDYMHDDMKGKEQ